MSDLHIRENTDLHVKIRDLLIEKKTYERNPQKSPICARACRSHMCMDIMKNTYVRKSLFYTR